MNDRIVFVFDLDGTILDSFNFFKKHAATVIAKFKIKADELIFVELQKELIELSAGKNSKILIFKLINHACRKLQLGPIARIRFFVYLKKLYKDNIDNLPCVPETFDVFKMLKASGHFVSILTTSSMKEFDEKMRNKQDIKALIDAVVVRDEVTRLKPDPEGLYLILSRLKLPRSSNVVVIGDMIHDIKCGINIEGISIGVLTGVNNRDELTRAGASLILDSIANLPSCMPQIRDLLIKNNK